MGVPTTDVEPHSQTITGDLRGEESQLTGSCGGHGSERVYRIVLDEPKEIHAAVEGQDAVLYIRNEVCDNEDKEIMCDRFGRELVGSFPPGVYYLIVDAFRTSEDPLPFSLHLEFSESPVLACENRFDVVNVDPVSQTFGGRLAFEGRDDSQLCPDAIFGPSSSEDVYGFIIERPTRLHASLFANEEVTVLYLRKDNCARSSETACANNSHLIPFTQMVETLQPGRYFLFVDGGTSLSNHDYRLVLDFKDAE